jgi:hypothetical protein
MKPAEIERWALTVLDLLKGGQSIEDSRVELKRNFGDPDSIARRIAGHANAARGDHLLWLFGVDEKTHTIIGVNGRNFADWWNQIKARFKSLPPEVLECNVPCNGLSVLALLIYTDRVPLLVKNPSYGKTGGGSVEFEVPWREMTGVRTARREDILRILLPMTLLPDVEILSGSLRCRGKEFDAGAGHILPPSLGKECDWELSLELYFVPRGQTPIIIPAHKCKIVVSNDAFGSVEFSRYTETVRGITSPLRQRDRKVDISIHAPERLDLVADFRQRKLEKILGAKTVVQLELQPAGHSNAIVLHCTLKKVKDWSYRL